MPLIGKAKMKTLRKKVRAAIVKSEDILGYIDQRGVLADVEDNIPKSWRTKLNLISPELARAIQQVIRKEVG